MSSLPTSPSTTLPINSNTGNLQQQQQQPPHQTLFTTQTHHFPQVVTPYTFLHFEKTDTLHYISSIRWVSLKWFTICRFLALLGFIAFTPVLILTHLSFQNEADSIQHTPHFFLTPYWLLHCTSLLFYLIVCYNAFNKRTLLKQLHEYTTQLDPIPTFPSLRFAHFFYILNSTLIPTFYILEYFLSRHHYQHNIPLYHKGHTIYNCFVGMTIAFEVLANNIPILLPHVLFDYTIGLLYFGLCVLLYKWMEIDIQLTWWQLYPRDRIKIPLFVTLGLFIAALHFASFLFCIYRQLRCFKKQRKKDIPQDVAYFFNTTEFGTRLRLPMATNYTLEVDR